MCMCDSLRSTLVRLVQQRQSQQRRRLRRRTVPYPVPHAFPISPGAGGPPRLAGPSARAVV